VGFQVLAAASTKKFTEVSKMPVASINRVMDAASTSETSVNVYQATRRNNKEDKSSSKVFCSKSNV
jgi:hypothetical protein